MDARFESAWLIFKRQTRCPHARSVPELGLHLSAQQNQRRQSEKNKESTGIRDGGQQYA